MPKSLVDWAKGKQNGSGKECVIPYLEPKIKCLDQLGFKGSWEVSNKKIYNT